jgi:molecular chaperone GrpE
MNLTLRKFSDTLEKFGVVIIDPQGEKFNPDRHNAVSMADTGEFEPGVVMSVLQKGYELNGRLVRPAMVVVSK